MAQSLTDSGMPFPPRCLPSFASRFRCSRLSVVHIITQGDQGTCVSLGPCVRGDT
jgi:hypothetical protein